MIRGLTNVSYMCLLQDGLIANQNAGSMQMAFAAKADGAAQIADRSCGLLPIASWTAFSSIAGLLGSAGQASYAAANAVLDAWTCAQHLQVTLPCSICTTQVNCRRFVASPLP